MLLARITLIFESIWTGALKTSPQAQQLSAGKKPAIECVQIYSGDGYVK
jgi:hypothetical protein